MDKPLDFNVDLNINYLLQETLPHRIVADAAAPTSSIPSSTGVGNLLRLPRLFARVKSTCNRRFIDRVNEACRLHAPPGPIVSILPEYFSP